MAAKGGIHWFAPTCMILSLLAGSLLAVAHHFFYDFRDGQPVPGGDYEVGASGYTAVRISRQQATITIGTALAFATRTCLVIAVSTAWVQLFWSALAKRSSNKPLTLEKVDVAFSACRNAFTLLNLPGWRRFFPVFLLALATWLIPIASIITPATIAVHFQPVAPPLEILSVLPSIAFDRLSYVAAMSGPGSLPYNIYEYSKPSSALRRIAAAVGAQGDILPLYQPSPNSSWQTTFSGPVLRCEELPESEQLIIQANIADWLRLRSPYSNCASPRAYQSWYGKIPYRTPTERGAVEVYNSSYLGPTAATPFGSDSPIFRLAVLPNMLQVNESHGLSTACDMTAHEQDPSAPLGNLADNSTMLQCQVSNSTYHVDFEYINGTQNIIIDAPKADSDELVYFRQLVAGPVNASCPGAGDTDSAIIGAQAGDHPCVVNSTALQRLSYLAILDSVVGLMSGSLGVDGSPNNAPSRIAETSLVNTYELSFLADDTGRGTETTLQKAFSDVDRPDIAVPVNVSPGSKIQPLANAIEELFQNVTVSLLSELQFTALTSDTTKVTHHNYHNVYVYTRTKLWLAYGIALLCTIFAVATGLYVIITSGASYSSDFSTIVRAARGAGLSNEVESKDTDGRDPLPKYLKKTTITMSNVHGKPEMLPEKLESATELGDTGKPHFASSDSSGQYTPLSSDR